MIVPVNWIEMRGDDSAVVKIKQRGGSVMPVSIGLEQLHQSHPRMKHINSLKVLVALIKKKGGTIELPNIKMGDKREKRLEARKEEEKWSSE